MRDEKRVFISYNAADYKIAKEIVDELNKGGIQIANDFSTIGLAIPFISELRYAIESSDIVIILISKNYLPSKLIETELQSFLSEAKKRKVTVIPVAVGRLTLPYELLEYEVLNLSSNYKEGMRKLILRLQRIPDISFESFDAMKFEDFVNDLLREYGFKNIKKEKRIHNFIIDYTAEFISKNPFGMRKKELWLIETKFYRDDRFSVNSIQQLFEYKRQALPSDSKMLLVTNSILTSVVEEYLTDIQHIENTQIEIIDGLLLKKLVSRKTKLLNRYFSR